MSGARSASASGSSASSQARQRTGAPASGLGTGQRAGTGIQAAPLDTAFVEQVTARLALYLGPIAPIVTKKAARGAKNRSDFLQRVAENLGTQDRAAFLREVGLGGD